MKYLLILLCTVATLHSFAHSTDEANTSLPGLLPTKYKKSSTIDKQSILFGPGIGLGAGNRSFFLFISPSIAYCFTNKFHVGTTLGFSYFQQAFNYRNILTGQDEVYKYKIPAYIMSVYGRYFIHPNILINVEPEITNQKFITNSSFNTIDDYDLSTGKIKEKSIRIFIPSFLVGVGYTNRFGRNGYSFMMAGYDLIQNPNSRYYQTIDFRFGLMLDLFNR